MLVRSVNFFESGNREPKDVEFWKVFEILFWSQIQYLRKILWSFAEKSSIFFHSASSYGRNKFCIEFRSQCHLFRFGNNRRSPRRGFLGNQMVVWAGKASRRGLLGGWNCISSWTSVPQGPFGRINLHFELEKRLARTFWTDKIVIWAGRASRRSLFNQIFHRSHSLGRM